MNTAKRMRLLLALAIASLASGVALAAPQARPTGKLQAPEPVVKGPELYASYCSACHGADAKGNGPVASALKAKPSDLTAIAKSNKGVFPTMRIARIIAGLDATASHGTRAMPVWGPLFRNIQSDQVPADVRLSNLVRYIESIQVK